MSTNYGDPDFASFAIQLLHSPLFTIQMFLSTAFSNTLWVYTRLFDWGTDIALRIWERSIFSIRCDICVNSVNPAGYIWLMQIHSVTFTMPMPLTHVAEPACLQHRVCGLWCRRALPTMCRLLSRAEFEILASCLFPEIELYIVRIKYVRPYHKKQWLAHTGLPYLRYYDITIEQCF